MAAETVVGDGIIFLDLQPHLPYSQWWIWDPRDGWFGPIGAYVDTTTNRRRVRARIFDWARSEAEIERVRAKRG